MVSTSAGGKRTAEEAPVMDDADLEIDEELMPTPEAQREPPGMQLLINLDGRESLLLQRAAGLAERDFVRFAKEAVIEAATRVAGLGVPDVLEVQAGERRGSGRVAERVARDAYEVGTETGVRRVTIPEAAARFGVKRDRLQRAAMEGRLPATKLGDGRSHPWLVEPAAVEHFLATSKRGPKKRREVA